MRILLAAAMSLTLASIASAQWIYLERDLSAFSGGKQHRLLAVKIGQKGGFGIRCIDGSSQMIFIPSENMDAETTEKFNTLNPKLLFQVDKNEQHELATTAQIGRDGSTLLVSDIDNSLVMEIRDAKTRITVLMEFSFPGNRYEETRYPAINSTEAASELLRNCKLPGG